MIRKSQVWKSLLAFLALGPALSASGNAAAEALFFCGQSCSSDESKTSGIRCENWTPAPGSGQCQAKAFCSSSSPSGNCDVVLGTRAYSPDSAAWTATASISKRIRQPARSAGLYPLHFHLMDGSD